MNTVHRAALALGLFATPAIAHAGGLGDSCFSSRDCAPGLKCIDNACNREIPADAQARTRNAPPPARTGPGGQGESCFSARDCSEGLKCIDNVCGHEVPPSAMKAGTGPLGARGESCRARADCAAGLACIRETCSDPNARAKDDDGDHGGDWMRFELHGTHPFVGLAWMGGPVIGFTTGRFNTSPQRAEGSFLFALRGGVTFDNQELAVELSPMTFFPVTSGRGPAFQVNGTYGVYTPIHESTSVSVYWPLRIGVGMVAGGNNTANMVYFQALADIIGPAIRVGHIMIDLRLPSFRYLLTDGSGIQAHIFAWELGASVNYLF